jgi:phosphoribosylglycinamide formyltransferase-1
VTRDWTADSMAEARLSPVRIGILASGSGTNAERLMLLLRDRVDMQVERVYSNAPTARVIDRAVELNIPTHVFSKPELTSGALLDRLGADSIDFVVLAGFLLKVPASMVSHFAGRMANLHPALLPSFGGKGMYGEHVHRAVHQAVQQEGLRETGITLHWVTAGYDEGAIFFQASAALGMADDLARIVDKVRDLECKHFAVEMERAIESCFSLSRRWA